MNERLQHTPEFEEVPHSDMRAVMQDKLTEREARAARDEVEDLRERSFFVADLGVVASQLDTWRAHLPRVEPWYAVKCNTDLQLLRVLAGLGIGFDCASKAEIELILSLGVSPERIIYANPCKQVSFIRYASRVNVYLMTFDNLEELSKIKEHCPEAKLVLRVCRTAPAVGKVRNNPGKKFGCHPEWTDALLKAAKNLGLNVVGVSFHVGHTLDLDMFPAAVRLSTRVFAEARALGFQPWLLDIGGGFPGSAADKVSFPKICESLRQALDDHFPASSGVQLIAEPGRFFCQAAFTLAVCVIGVREADCREGAEHMYYVSDGVHASLNILLMEDDVEAQLTCLRAAGPPGQPEPCSVWGPTCDWLDVLSEHTLLPRMRTGDWLMFRDLGAYTLCLGTSFNGMPLADVYHVWMNAEETPPPSAWPLAQGSVISGPEDRGRTADPASVSAASNSPNCV